jgi:hypothetical protein
MYYTYDYKDSNTVSGTKDKEKTEEDMKITKKIISTSFQLPILEVI